MSVRQGDYFECRKCGSRSYCTMYLYCESCGHQDAKDRKFMVKHGRWTPKPCECYDHAEYKAKEGSNRPQGVDEP